MVTLASVADPGSLTLVSVTTKHILLQWACNRHLSMVELPNATRHWVPLTVSLASHLLDNFSTVVWLGLATCWRRTSERTLSVGSLHALVFCFTRFHQVLGWSSCLALSSQQACVRPCCFTGRPRPLGTGFFNGSMVLSFDLLLPPLRFLPYGFLATGSPQLTAF